jgi:hypothetical protein
MNRIWNARGHSTTHGWALFIVLLCGTMFWLLPTPASAVSTLDSVVVVPNPYNVSGRTFGAPLSNLYGFERIRFANLPPASPDQPTKIMIYTSALNLVTTLEHTTNDNTFFWNGRNSDNQYIVTGVYIYVVKDPNLGTKIGKFIVIR